VHVITVYLPPDNNNSNIETSNFYIRLIRFTIKELILAKDKNSKIMIMGDFNQYGMKKTDFISGLGL
jgi:exonuclease III